MAQILVRNLNKRIVTRLKERAKKDGRSLQSEVKTILEQAVNEPVMDLSEAKKISDQFQLKFKGRKFPSSTKLLHEDRK